MPSFINRFQYQQKTDPILPGGCAFQFDAFQNNAFQVCPQVFEFGSLSLPLRNRVAAGFAVALVASGAFFVPAPAEAITVDKWHQPLSEPIRKQNIAALQASSGAISPLVPIVAEDKWHQPLSVPMRRQVSVQADIGGTPVVTVAEVITADKWWQPLSDPVRQKQGLETRLQQAVSGPVLDPNSQITNLYESRWHYAWSDPVRLRQFPAAEQQSVAFVSLVAETITADKWLQPLTAPLRTIFNTAVRYQAYGGPVLVPAAPTPGTGIGGIPSNVSVNIQYNAQFQYQGTAAPVFTPAAEVITADKWFESWVDPVRQKIGLGAYLQQVAALVLNPNTQITNLYESRWHYAWSEPVRTRLFPTSEQQSVAFLFAPTETITIDKWTYPWAEPVRFRYFTPSLQPFLQSFFTSPVAPPAQVVTSAISSQVTFKQRFIYQTLAEPVSVPAEVITVDKWFEAFSEPQRFKPGLAAHLQQSFTTDTAVIPTSKLMPWFEPLNEPVRIKQGLPAAEQQALVWSTFTPEFITVDKWFRSWQEPVRFKPQLPAGEQQFLALVIEPNQVIQGFESRWHYTWSEPVRQRLFPAAEQQAFAFQPPSFEIVTVDKWFESLSEPKRFLRGLAAHLQQPFTADTTVIQISKLMPWFAPLNEPVRLRQFPVSEQQAIAQTVFVGEVITEDKWHQPWSEPNIKTKRGLGAQYQQAFTSDTAVIPLKRMVPWIYPWSEPSVKTKRGLGAQFQQAFTADTSVIPLRRMVPWIYPWSEPLRRLPGLGAWLQQVTAPEVPPFPNFVTTINWFAPFNEPVRLKIGLGSWLQQFYTASQEPITNLVLVTLSATETNNDRASFGIVEFLPICKAVVSVVEVKAINAGNVSIIAPDCINTT